MEFGVRELECEEASRGTHCRVEDAFGGADAILERLCKLDPRLLHRRNCLLPDTLFGCHEEECKKYARGECKERKEEEKLDKGGATACLVCGITY